MDAKRLMKRDEETYANLLPGLKYDIGEAVDRVKLMEQGNAPFHEPRDYLCWTWIVSMTPEEIATQRRLITKHEAAFAASTEWCVNVKEDDLYRLPDDVQTDFLRHLCGVKEGEEEQANLQGIVMAGPDRVEGKSPVSGPGQGSDGKAWEWMERRERVKERWYEAWAEVDQAYADFYKAFVELYRARVQHAKARAEFCEWLRQKPAAVSTKGNIVSSEQELDPDSVEQKDFTKYRDGNEEGSLSSPKEEDHADLQENVTAVPDYAEEEDLGDETASEKEDFDSGSENDSDLEERISEGSDSEEESDIDETGPEDAEKQGRKTQVEPAAVVPALSVSVKPEPAEQEEDGKSNASRHSTPQASSQHSPVKV